MKLYNERYRPQYHFSPKENWMNDPNGMVYYNGEYHLFYQYHPDGTTWGPMHWGHAISKDLTHWKQMPIALKPDEHGKIFSGSAVVDWNDTTGFFDGGHGLVAVFTHHDTCPESDCTRQRQSLAYSKDSGRTWEMYKGNPVLSNEDYPDFRDPKVFWHDESNKWIMSLACGQVIHFYGSNNLKNWEFLSEFGDSMGAHWGVWECPDLFQLPVEGTEEKKWVLIVSIGDNPDHEEGSRTQYFIGEFDGKEFINDNPGEKVFWLDHGRDNYAGVSWSDIPEEDGRRIYIAWMSNWRYANVIPTDGWRGAMTLPRELKLISTTDGIRIKQQVVKEIEQLRGRKHSEENQVIEANQTVEKGLNSEMVEVLLSFETKNENNFQMKLIDEDSLYSTVIGYDGKKNSVVVDRTNSGTNDFNPLFPAKDEVALLNEDSVVTLRVFVDQSSIEVFINDGEESLTYLLFPHDKIKKLTLVSQNGTTQVHSFIIHELKEIWN